MKDHNLNPNDFELDEIVSIELIGEEETVDITVEDTHMFYANDIYTHNSGIDSEVIEADKIADSYAKVMNADFIMSLSRKSKDKLNNTARMHIMKNRFGQDGITFPCKMDTNRGILEIYTATSSDGIIAAKESKNGEVVEKQMLHKKYLENMDMG
jgi:hypothetical protein